MRWDFIIIVIFNLVVQNYSTFDSLILPFFWLSAFRMWSKLFRRISWGWAEKPDSNLSNRYVFAKRRRLTAQMGDFVYLIPNFFVGEGHHIALWDVLSSEWAAHTHLKGQEGWTSVLLQKANQWNVCQNQNVNFNLELPWPHCQSQIFVGWNLTSGIDYNWFLRHYVPSLENIADQHFIVFLMWCVNKNKQEKLLLLP